MPNLSNDVSMYSPDNLHSIVENKLMSSISSNSAAVDLFGGETSVEKKYIVNTIDYNHEFKSLEIEHIGECAEVPFNATWCSVIAGS